MNNICALILAAGSSTRMKQPKQLLSWQNQPLLEYQIRKLISFPFAEIIVVLGHKANKINKQISINDSRTTIIICDTYHEGLSSSIKYGLTYAKKKYCGIVILLVDLPLIETNTIKLVLQIGSEKLLTANEPFVIQPSYKKLLGHPVFIGNFPKLDWHKLSGDQGAKPLIRQIVNKTYVETKDCGVLFDIDTNEAYEEAKIIAAARIR